MQDEFRQPVDLTLILNAHQEGELAVATLQNAQRVIAHASANSISVEWIVVLDSPDTETARTVSRFSEDISRILTVDYQDLGLSRNAGIREAQGQLIAFLDADDLFCEDWLTASVRYARLQNQPVVLHPEIDQLFGKETVLVKRRPSTDPRFSPLNLLAFNEWSALCVAPRNLFLRGHWYHPIDLPHGFGFEDWHWNCETLAAGYAHLVVPQTRHFLRQKTSGSLGKLTTAQSAVFRPTKLFSEWMMGKNATFIQESQTAPARNFQPGIASRTLHSFKQRLLRIQQRKRCAVWNPLESNSGNESQNKQHQQTIQVPSAYFVRFYPELLRTLATATPPFLLCSELSKPDVRMGVEHFLEMHAELCCIVFNGKLPNNWRKLSPRATFLDLPKLTPGCYASEREQLLLRALLQTTPHDFLLPIGKTATRFSSTVSRRLKPGRKFSDAAHLAKVVSNGQ